MMHSDYKAFKVSYL